MTLKLVKPGEDLPADETMAERRSRAQDACASIRAAAEGDGEFWCLVSEADLMSVCYIGDPLEMACIAEEVARRLRLSVIGFGEDE